jgi:hypothetical protein
MLIVSNAPRRAVEGRRQVLRRVGGGGLAAGLLALVGRGGAAVAAAQPAPIDPLQPLRALFEFHVRQGPSAGLDLSGDLSLNVDPAGALSGTWRLVDQTVVDVVGQATGRAVNLLLTLPDGRRVFGVGTAERGLGDAPTTIGGVGAGPAEGDFADWLISPQPGTPGKPGGSGG